MAMSSNTSFLQVCCNALEPIKHKWFKIGIQLKVPYHKLKEFKDEDDPLSSVITYCSRGNIEGATLSWESVARALESPQVDESGTAKNIRSQYCQKGRTRGFFHRYLWLLVLMVIPVIAAHFLYHCPPVPDPANGVVMITGHMSWITATYTCNSGFELNLSSGNKTRICQLDGTWMGSAPLCAAPAIYNFRNHLKLLYQKSPIDDKNKWLHPDNSRRFVRLTLVKGRARKYIDSVGHIPRGNFKQEVEERTEISMEQILEASDDGHKPSLVLIEGAPGIGKSYLAWELCKMWVNGTYTFMEEFKLVILYRLREKGVQEISSIRELFSLYNAKYLDSLVNEVENDGSGILFILDGFDELPKTCRSNFPLLKLINEQLLGSRVLITTRPSATEELLANYIMPHKRIEVLGFDQKSVETFAFDVFKDKPETLWKFKAYTSLNNPVVNSMMYVPLNAAIVIHMFENNPDNLLPRTLTELYKQLFFTILNKALTNKNLNKVDNFEGLPENLYALLHNLSKVAFEGMENDSVIFYSPPHDFVDLGFLDAASIFHEKDYTYNFLHLTIQEFFAAYYISKNENSGLEIFKQYGKENRWNVVWRFVAGLTGFKDYDGHIEQDVFFKYYRKGGSIFVKLFFIQCFFEAKSMHYNLSIFDNLTSLTYNYDRTDSINALDMYALGYLIVNFQTNNIPWILEISNEAVEFLTSGLAKNQPITGSGAIEQFYLSITHPSNNTLAFNPTHFGSLRVFSLEGFLHLYSSYDLMDLSEMVPDMHCLETLNISIDDDVDVPIENEDYLHGMLKLLQKLSDSRVASLSVKNTGFISFFRKSYHEYSAALRNLIEPSSGKLKKLRVGDNVYSNYHNNADKVMEQLLSTTSSLETLHLYNLLPHLSLMNNTNLSKLVLSSLESCEVNVVADNEVADDELRYFEVTVRDEMPLFTLCTIFTEIDFGSIVAMVSVDVGGKVRYQLLGPYRFADRNSEYSINTTTGEIICTNSTSINGGLYVLNVTARSSYILVYTLIPVRQLHPFSFVPSFAHYLNFIFSL